MMGLRHIHRTRLVHRDLKPENVFLHFTGGSSRGGGGKSGVGVRV